MSKHMITSTADLTPDGVLGYAKGIAATLVPILIVVVEYLPEGNYKRWTQLAIAVLGAIAVIGVANKVKATSTAGAAIPPMPDLPNDNPTGTTGL